ncbi:MAG: HpcH/HpaI aldolase/citrate lyase family protein [Betaproteobacteria bacterium]
MDLPRNTFKHAIATSQAQYGAWLMSAAPSTAEALGCAGFDFLVVDMEHTPIDTPQMIEILRAIAGTRASPITRVPWNDMVMVKRALDAGAQSIMFPFVQDEHEAARAVAFTRYPPAGVRGAAGVHRGSRYGTVPNYFKLAADEICVIVQIETLQALERLTAIAAVPGVDSIFVGPGDLSGSMGHLGDIGHADVQAKLAHAAAECKRLGKPCGIIGPNPEMVERFLGYGYSWVAIGSDMSMMMGRAQEWLGKLRGSTAAAPKAQGPY